jgi:Zn-dependent protease
MLRPWKLGKAFGIGIFVHWSFLLLPVWVFFSHLGEGPDVGLALYMVTLILALFGCVVLHELGHALKARRFGIATRRITLYPIGGVASLERMSERPAEELWIALAGPAVNVVIAAALGAVLFLSGGPAPFEDHFTSLSGRTFLTDLMFCNVALVVFNLLPIFPMDGGRVFRALLSLFLGRLRATEIAAAVGTGMVIFLPMLFLAAPGVFSPMLILVGFFVFVAGQQELAAVRYQAAQQARGASGPEDFPEPPIGTAFGEGEWPSGNDPALDPGFSGIKWDGRARAWILWRHGRPIRTIWVE